MNIVIYKFSIRSFGRMFYKQYKFYTIMKKFLFLSVCILFSANAFSQLKVANNGNSMFGLSSSETPLSAISVGSIGRADSKLTVLGDNNGIFAYRNGNAYPNWGNAIMAKSPVGTANFCVGIRSEAVISTPNSSCRAYGIYGVAGNATSGYNYGLFGRLSGSNNGAAVYGTISNVENGINTGGQYAGYFNGATKVVGDLTVTGSVKGLVLGAAASEADAISTFSLEEGQTEDNNLTDKISQLNLLSYYLPQAYDLNINSAAGSDSIEAQQPTSKIETQNIEKRHFGLSLERLKEVFPDLVYEQEDGSYGVNYMEMVPILVKTINELNNRLSVLEGKNKAIEQPSKTKILSNTTSVLELKVNDNIKDAAINVYNINGVFVKKIKVTNRGVFSINLSKEDLADGLYIYALVADGNIVSTKRVAIEN